MRERGWQLPAYTFPENRTDLAALRVVVRRGFTHDMADMLVADLERQLPRLQSAARARPRRGVREPPSRTDVSLARVLGIARPARGAPLQAEALAHRPEPPLHDGRRDDERRRVRHRLVRRRSRRRERSTRVEPAWNDRNLRDLAAHIESRSRVRAHPRLVGNARAADELPPVPPRQLAVDAQRGPSATSSG